MKIEHHLNKARRFQATIGKLDYEDDYETMIEDFLLAAAHLVNASMHKLQVLKQDSDIKHNQLSGILRRERSLGEYSDEVSELIQRLEQLRPSYVYGKGENGKTAKKAEEIFVKLKDICHKILENEI